MGGTTVDQRNNTRLYPQPGLAYQSLAFLRPAMPAKAAAQAQPNTVSALYGRRTKSPTADPISTAGRRPAVLSSHHLESNVKSPDHTTTPTLKMAAKNLPAAFNATSQDIEMLLSAQCHLGSKNMQVHMEPYLWKTRADGINILNVGKTWYVAS